MYQGNTSSAYALSSFETKPKRERKPERLDVVENRNRAVMQMLNLQVLAAFAMIVALISLMVYNQVQLNEIVGQTNALQKELQVLESENVRLESLKESTVSLRVVAERAKDELGMQRLDDMQTVRIYLYKNDKIESGKNVPPPATQKLKLLSAFFGRFKEYLAG